MRLDGRLQMLRVLGLASGVIIGLIFSFQDVDAQDTTIVYVDSSDPKCGGNNPCFKTIQGAIDAAQPRTTIRIRAGRYTEQLKIEKNAFGGAVEADRIIIESDPSVQQEQVILVGPSGSSCTNNYAIRVRRSKFVTIRGLTITGAGGPAILMMGENNGNQGIHVELNRIFGNSPSNSCNGGIEINAGNPETIIANNLVYANGRNAVSLIGDNGGPQYIISNTIYSNRWNGVEVSAGQQVLLANNLINSNGTASGNQGTRFGVVRESAGTSTPQKLQLRNNVVCGNTLGELIGPILDSSDSGNFTPLGNEGPGLAALPDCGNPASIFANRNGPDGTPNTIDDDFSLKSGSLAIDVGMDPRTLGLSVFFNPIFEADFHSENVRPADGNADRAPAFDASAFEYPNAPPVANAGVNQSVYRGQLVTLSGVQSSDPEGASLSYQWSIVSQPSGSNITLSDANSAVPTFTPLFIGDYNFQLIVNDGQLASAAAAVKVTTVNRLPIVNAGGPYVGVAGIPVQFSGSGSDPDNDPITFTWNFGDGGTAAGAAAVHTYSAIGSYNISLTATDSLGARATSTSIATIDGVNISKIEPSGGTIGALVTITGTNFEPEARVTFNGTPAVVRTITSNMITTTVPVTAISGPVTVTTSRGSASRNFTVSTIEDFSIAVNPASIQTVQGGSTSIVIEATPSNGFTGLIQLTAASLPHGTSANFSPSTLAPSNYSVLTLSTSAGATTGAHVIEIRAMSQMEGRIVTKTASFNLNISESGQTVLTGQILDGDDRPVANVSIKLGGTSITHLGSSDAAGNLFIPLAVSGKQVFLIDGSSANTADTYYPTIPVTLDIQSSAVNELGYVPRLRGQPAAKLIPFVPGQASVITDPELPGFKMTIPAGVRIIGWDGQANSKFSVVKVPVDRSPLPPLLLGPGLEARETFLFSFAKMGGGVPTGNIPIDLPNSTGRLPGEKADLYYFNEAPDGSAPNQWEKYGTATVSDDATTLVTDINPATGLQYGIPRFCCGALTPVFSFINRLFGLSGGPNDGGSRAGDPVDLSTGFFYVDKTDMVLPGRIPVVITRTHRTNMPNPGLFGYGATASFDIWLQAPSVFNNQTIVLVSPGNKQDIFSRQSDGTYVNTTSPRLRGARLTVTGPADERDYTLRFKDGMAWNFNTSGLLTRQSDQNGNTVTYFRDTFNRVVRIREPGGRDLVFEYDPSTPGLINIQSITDPIGRQVRYTYDFSGQLQTVTDAGGGVTRYTYDSGGKMLTLTDPRGITFLANEYDADGRIVKQTQADGGVWAFAYTSNGSYISRAIVTNPRGHSTIYRFNAAGYQVSETNALGHTTSLERQTGSNLLRSVTDPLKRVTRFEHDALGNVTRIIDPTGNARVFTYSENFNKITSITDPLANVASFEYDVRGNLSTIVDPLGHRTSIENNNFGQPVVTTDPLGGSTRFTYDAMGNIATITSPAGSVIRKAFDPVSRLIAQTDPRDKVTRFSYDSLNHIIQTTDPLGGATEFNYDRNGNLLSLKDARGSVTSYSYDNMDRVAARTDPLGAMESFEYDTAGNLIRHTDRDGRQSLAIYDPLNRMIGGTYADNASTSFAYDAAGRMIEARDSVGGTITQQHDPLDRLIGQITNLGSVSYQYDSLGRRTQVSLPGQSPIAYFYDGNSELRSMIQGGQELHFDYDLLGRRTRLLFPNSLSTEYQYDSASRLTKLIYRNAVSILGDLTYGYDSAGNRTSISGTFARTRLPDAILSASYDAANRQLGFGNNTMSYDGRGNVTTIANSAGITDLTWDARNRLIGLAGPGGKANFVYDAFGRRASKNISGQLTQYLYDGMNPVLESSANMIANSLTGLGIDEYFSRTESLPAQTNYLFSDALGSVVAMSGSSGNIQSEYTYEPFGKATATGTSSLNPFQYTGRENDNNGLYYYRARYYHPGLQRFISEDSLGFGAGDVNLYTYAQNSVTNFRDPTGNFIPVAAVGGALCATGAVAGASAYKALAGRKSSLEGMLAGAAAGCAGAIGLGWGIGIALEAAVPTIMAGGGQVTLWGGLGATGAQLAGAEATASNAATIFQTFSGSALRLLEGTGLSTSLTGPLWKELSANFVSGASSATALIGSSLATTSTLIERELPVLREMGTRITYVLFP